MRSQHLLRSAALAAVGLALPTAAASAATMSYAPPIGTQAGGVVTYQADGGEVNTPEITTPEGTFGRLVALLSDTAPVLAGAGCTAGTPLTCGDPDTTSRIVAHLGDGEDDANVFSNISPTSVYGDSGADTIRSGGTTAYAEGGSGDDRVRVYGVFLSEGHGSSGDDAVYNQPSTASVELSGDTGADLLGVAGRSAADLGDGGGGDDRIVMTGLPPRGPNDSPLAGGTFLGGTGDDLLAAQAQHWANGPFEGGSGNDTLSVPFGRTAADGGSGDDLIDVVDRNYNPGVSFFFDTVTCGSGADEVWADPGDTVAADCETVHVTTSGPELPGVADAVAAANALLGQ